MPHTTRKTTYAELPRSCQLNIRLTEREADVLTQRAQDAGLTKTRLIVSLITGQFEFVSVDKSALLSVYRELAAQGNNINQIAHALNVALATTNSDERRERIETALNCIIAADLERIGVYRKATDIFAVGR